MKDKNNKKQKTNRNKQSPLLTILEASGRRASTAHKKDKEEQQQLQKHSSRNKNMKRDRGRSSSRSRYNL